MVSGMDDDVIELTPEQGEMEMDSAAANVADCPGENKELKARILSLEKLVEKMQQAPLATLTSGDGYYVPFFDYYKFCRMELREAALYIAEDIKPKIRKIMGDNKAKFLCMIKHKLVVRRINMRSCTNFNQNKGCNVGRGDYLECHTDKLGFRLHCCNICYEVLGSFHLHRAGDCQLVRLSYYKDLDVNIH